jgi:predicted dehydrogenase
MRQKKRGVDICVVHDQLFYPSIQKAKDMIASHDITTVITRVRLNKYLTNFGPWVEEVAEGGFLWEECHAVYLQQYFLEDIKEVYAIGTQVGSRVYNNLYIVLRTPYQSYGIIEVDILSKEQEKSCEIKTSTGSSIEIDLFTDTLFKKARKPLKGISGLAYRFLSDESRILQKYLKYGLKLLRYGTISISHYILINSYLESLQQGAPPPVPPEQGRDTIKLLECIQESLNKHSITVN